MSSEAELKYKVLFEQSPYGIVIVDLNGKILDFNETAHRDLGYTREEFSALSVSDIDPDESPGDVLARTRRILEDGGAAFEVRHVTKQGEIRNVYAIIKPVVLSGKTIFHGIWQDITERKKTVETIRMFAEVVQHTRIGVVIGTLEGTLGLMNPAFAEMHGYTIKELYGRPITEVYPTEVQACIQGCIEIINKEGYHKFETLRLRKDGSVFPAEIEAYAIKDKEGRTLYRVANVQDITGRKRAEERMHKEAEALRDEQLKSEKLKAIGTLAGGIAHDFNNLLQGVFGYISLAKVALDPGGKAFENLGQAEKALNMSINLANQLLTFSKGGKPVKRNVALAAVIENSAKFALSGSRSICRITSDKGLWNVEADEGQIGQVIQNIVLNASEAMPGGGTVEISLENSDIPEGSKLSLPQGGKFVKIVIRDSGTGIQEQCLPRIFDPYFTTKQQGSGLGLATSYSIVKNHGGLIEAASGMGKGAAFYVYLPAGNGDETHNARVLVPAAGRKGKILLMDDEDMVRDVAARMIEKLGHEAQTAEDGEDAIRKFRHAMDSGKPFDIVILDLTVRRGMGGERAIARLLELEPAVKAIVSSGYSDNPVISDYRSYGFSAFLNKPYMMNALKDSINVLLGNSQAS